MPKCQKCGSENVDETGAHATGIGDHEKRNIAWSPEQSDYRCRDCEECFSAPAAETKQ